MGRMRFGGYRLITKLGVGGTAEVWLARPAGVSAGPGKFVVVKRLLPYLSEDPDFSQVLLSEMKVAARLIHPNLAHLYDVGEVDGRYFIATEYVRGADLGVVMRRAIRVRRWPPVAVALRIGVEVCKALVYLHGFTDPHGRRLGLVHGELGPDSLRLSFDGVVKVLDMGMRRVGVASLSARPHAIIHRIGYLSPEQVMGKPLDARTDVFTLGMVLYELVTQVRPFKGETDLQTVKATLDCALEAPSKVSTAPAWLDEPLMRALAKRPEDRYADAAAFAAALEGVLAAQGLSAGHADLAALMASLFDRDEPLVIHRVMGGAAADEDVVGRCSVDGTVTLENEKSGARWFVSAEDTLIVRDGPPVGLDFVGREMGTQPVASFPAAAGRPDVQAVVELAERVAAAAGCRVERAGG